MSAHYDDQYYHLGELSRKKLSKVNASSDTLRRAVLIHNVMRSTASLPPSPTQENYQYQYPDYSATPVTLDEQEDGVPIAEEQEELDYLEAARTHRAGAEATAPDSNMFVFPRLVTSSTASEQDWLDSILDDLEGDPLSQQPDEYQQCSPPLPPTMPSPPVSPLLQPASPVYATPTSPPSSPPALDVDTIDSDDDDFSSDEEDFSEIRTPSASIEFTPSDNYFFNHLPFRHRSRRFQPAP